MTRCLVCGRDPGRYPHHDLLHRTLTAARVAEVEAANLALRDSLGLPAGSAALPSWGPTVPASLPGIGTSGPWSGGVR